MQSSRNLLQDSDGRILQPPFKPAHIGPVYSRIQRKRLLRDKPQHPEPPDIWWDESIAGV